MTEHHQHTNQHTNTMDLSVELPLASSGQSLRFKNPVLTASGTFGYGIEFAPYVNLSSLGGIVVKGLSLKPRRGNALPRISETACGMLNAVGLQNEGVEAFVREKLPQLPWQETPVIANLYATAAEDFVLENGIACLTPEDRETMLRFANGAAYIVTTRKGAIRSMPERSEVEALLAAN